MLTIVVILHVLVAVALILVVLLQTGKGASMGAAFGGGASSTVFGSRGPSSFMSKLTAAAAIIFMLTSLGLSFFGGETRIGHDSVMSDTTLPAAEETAPAAETVPTAPVVPKDEAQPINPSGD